MGTDNIPHEPVVNLLTGTDDTSHGYCTSSRQLCRVMLQLKFQSDRLHAFMALKIVH